jgi:hypothetical protein
MATVPTKVSATQNSIKYQLDGTGAGVLTRATLIADCVAGALKAFLTGQTTVANWLAAWNSGGKLSVTLTGQAGAPTSGAQFVNAPPLQINVNQTSDVQTVLEIRFHETPQQ